ncbi:MAG TPA: diphthine--ammonia ligase [Micropepsaceae bacterium]|nr:diphthine--ammonia ligase [Micropepsaceae bacterium]
MSNSPSQKPVVLSWSGGKDSCLALNELLASPEFHIEALLTTVTRDYGRISMHGVRTALLERQAESLGLPLQQLFISKGATNAEYESCMAEAFSALRGRGIDAVAFGDLFLEDIKSYRDRFLARHGMTGLYPIWQRHTGTAIRDFIAAGFKTIIVCVDSRQLDPAFAGRIIDEQLLSELSPACDPCGENGEFHTFVFDGPIFSKPVQFVRGEIVCRDSFWFCDLIPA